MILDRSERKSWRRVQFENELIGAITKDGLLYGFRVADVKHLLDAKYDTDGTVWWFNKSHDRECAELHDWHDMITVNPQTVLDLFGYPLVWE